MPARVVHRLEAVQVAVQNTRPLTTGQRLRELVAEQGAVGQAGERVRGRGASELGEQPKAVMCLLGHADEHPQRVGVALAVSPATAARQDVQAPQQPAAGCEGCRQPPDTVRRGCPSGAGRPQHQGCLLQDDLLHLSRFVGLLDGKARRRQRAPSPLGRTHVRPRPGCPQQRREGHDQQRHCPQLLVENDDREETQAVHAHEAGQSQGKTASIGEFAQRRALDRGDRHGAPQVVHCEVRDSSADCCQQPLG